MRRCMVDDTIDQAKAALRQQAHAARASMLQVDRAEAAQAVSRLFFDAVIARPEDTIAAYWAIRDELDCQPILLRLMESTNKVLLPAVIGADQPLALRVWEQGTALSESGFGTLAPSPLAPQAEPDIILVPMLGFDRYGTRLGYGGGYYDRTLASLTKKPKLVGLAFAVQELPLIPRDTHDIPLDLVITEAGVHQFGPAA
jgi:5-formyltetrahydrofolate cyclo-ligase